jgi:type III restriction enzyme
VVSDFGLTDAIESGLVKIPQLAVRDTTGKEIPGYFNIWRWILPQLTPAERGGRRANPKPEAILKWAHTPIAMLGGLWEVLRSEWTQAREDPRPPVFILVCKNTTIAKVVYEWLAEDKAPTGIPPIRIPGFRNLDGQQHTIRFDSKHDRSLSNARTYTPFRRKPSTPSPFPASRVIGKRFATELLWTGRLWRPSVLIRRVFLPKSR